MYTRGCTARPVLLCGDFVKFRPHDGHMNLNKQNVEINIYTYNYGRRDSSVGIATRYGLDGTGIESRWGRGFPHPSRHALEPTQPPVQWVPGLSRG